MAKPKLKTESLMKTIDEETRRLEQAGPFSLQRIKAAVRMLTKGAPRDTMRMVQRYRDMKKASTPSENSESETSAHSKAEEEPSGTEEVSSSDYWTEHNVTQHHEFNSAEESLEYFEWRNTHYFDYIDLMPVAGEDGNVVLDYGCGPGHDTVGFGVFSKPSRLIAMEVSPTSLEEARKRVALHGFEAEFILIKEEEDRLPFEDNSVDTIHSSGVIHHTPDPVKILREFKRILKPGGEIRIMIYNYDSVFVHLFVAWMTQIRDEKHADESVRDAFRHLTDGPGCPISNVYTPAEFIALGTEAGLKGELTGVSVSVPEVDWLSDRCKAIIDRQLAKEHRDFLAALEFDKRGLPMIDGVYAGVDGCFRFTKN